MRHLAVQTAWLDTSPRWHEGRARWPFAEGAQTHWLTPGAAELSAAERALNKIESHPRALETAIGSAGKSGADWLARRRAQLEVVKRLARLEAADLPLLARSSRARNPDTARRLVELLLAEALCRNDLPVSPATVLMRRPELEADTLLIALCHDENQPCEARALAALVAGTREAAGPPQGKQLRAVFLWARKNGFSDTPALTARLLLEDNGAALVARLAMALPRATRLDMDAGFWRELLSEGRAPDEVVGVLESVASCEFVALRLAQNDLPEWPLPLSKLSAKMQAAIAVCADERRAWREELAMLLRDFVRENDATLIHAMRVLATALLDLEGALAHWVASASLAPERNPLLWAHLRGHLCGHVLQVLREVHQLKPSLRAGALRLLNENFAQVWKVDTFPKLRRARSAPGQVAQWLQNSFNGQGRLILRLLRRVGESTAREALMLNLADTLAGVRWRGSELAAWSLQLAREFSTGADDLPVKLRRICELLEEFQSIAPARAALRPVLEALRGINAAQRNAAFLAILNRLSWDGAITKQAAQLPPYVPAIARFAAVSDDWDTACFAGAALVLADEAKRAANLRIAPCNTENSEEDDVEGVEIEEFEAENAPDTVLWLEWVASDLLRTRPADEDGAEPVRYWYLDDVTRLAWTLSGGDFACFQQVFRVAARHSFANLEYLRRALPALWHFPAVQPALGHWFPRQPALCVALLQRWGLAHRLGDVLEPLEVLRQAPSAIPVAWRGLLELAPDVWDNAAQLALAQGVLGRAVALPPGVRHVLETPRKLENERAHLAARHAQTPNNSWAARLANLEKRLRDMESLRRAMADEAREKMRDIAAEAMLEAIKQQVVLCYRARLDEVAGPLPNNLTLDDDWLNAVLLTADVDYNRKLLWALLRAGVRSEDDWRETHPANAQFLLELAERGVDAAAWLDAHPHRFRSGRSTYHLRLETRPLAILQMGNYFDTCLSFGGINSFSTVANACELNKRVIFARDDKGRIAGRKLIGLNEDGKLIGFHTYTSLQDAEANRALRRVFARYCELFAARCNLEMAEQGTIPKLFAEDWYDDGVVDWRDEDDKKHSRKDNHATSRLVAAGNRR